LRTGVVFLALSGSIAWVGWDAGGWGQLAYWPAGSLALVASGYFGLGAAIFGKRPDGSLSIGRGLLLLPYLVLAWSVWHLSRKLGEIPPWQQLTESIVIGRRLLPHEVPERVTAVVDLTSEFPEPAGVRRNRVYLCSPILDRSVPEQRGAEDSPAAALARIVQTRPTVRLAPCQRAFVERHWGRAVAAGQLAGPCAAGASAL